MRYRRLLLSHVHLRADCNRSLRTGSLSTQDVREVCGSRPFRIFNNQPVRQQFHGDLLSRLLGFEELQGKSHEMNIALLKLEIRKHKARYWSYWLNSCIVSFAFLSICHAALAPDDSWILLPSGTQYIQNISSTLE